VLLLCVLESVWEPPTEGFLSVAEQDAEENKKTKDKEKTACKKKAPSAGPKTKRKKTDKDSSGDGDDDDGEETTENDSKPPVRGEFEPFMMETTRIGSWKMVETM